MNKKLMALAVAGAVSPGFAVAQGFQSATPTQIAQPAGVASNAGITLYGRLDETVMVNKYGDNGAAQTGAAAGQIKSFRKGDIYSPGNAMGIRGREDLGGGTAAWFQLEIGVWPDARLETSTTTGNNWGGRNSGIGISSGIGDVLFGNWDTPYKVTYGVWNSITSGGFSAAGVTMGNGDSTGALNPFPTCTNTVSNASGSVTTTPGGVCVTEATSNGTAWSRRINNSIQYWSPIWSGFQFKLMTAVANYQNSDAVQPASGKVKPAEYSANATWARGPISLGAGIDVHQGLRPGTAAGQDPNTKDSAFQLGFKWNFGPGEIGVGLEGVSYGDQGGAVSTGKMDVPAYVVNGRWNVGPGAIWASYSHTDAKNCATPTTVIGSAACGVQAKMYTLGYDYVLSKRTKMYVAFHKIDNGVTTSGTTVVASSYYYIAGPAANLGNNGGLSPGTDVTSFGFGVQHLF